MSRYRINTLFGYAMKRQWIAFSLVVLGWGVQTSEAIAQGNMRNGQLNTRIRYALCTQDWAGAIQAIDQMKRVTSVYRQELDYYRARLVLMRDQRTRIPSWPDAEYCAGNSPGIFPNEAANNSGSAASPGFANINLPAPPPTAPSNKPSAPDGSITPESLVGIWYGTQQCQFNNPNISSESFTFEQRYTVQYKPDNTTSSKGYAIFKLNIQEGDMTLVYRVSTTGCYQLQNRRLSEIASDASVSIDQVVFNNFSPTEEQKTLFEQAMQQYLQDKLVNVPFEYVLSFNAKREIVVDGSDQIAECNISPLRPVVNQLF
jgi:hypothetical protein